MVGQFHDGMMARVVEDDIMSEPFPVKNGAKQGCVLAPSLFRVPFAAMLWDAFKNLNPGIWIRFRNDEKMFNLRRLQAKTKVLEEFVHKLLLADDCSRVAHSQENIKSILDCFAAACSHYGLTINWKKTEGQYKPEPGNPQSKVYKAVV